MMIRPQTQAVDIRSYNQSPGMFASRIKKEQNDYCQIQSLNAANLRLQLASPSLQLTQANTTPSRIRASQPVFTKSTLTPLAGAKPTDIIDPTQCQTREEFLIRAKEIRRQKKEKLMMNSALKKALQSQQPLSVNGPPPRALPPRNPMLQNTAPFANAT